MKNYKDKNKDKLKKNYLCLGSFSLVLVLVECSGFAIYTIMQNVLASFSRMNAKRKQRI